MFEHAIDRKSTAGSWAYSIFLVLLSAVLQALCIQAFVEPLHLISGGFTGIALFIANVGGKFGLSLSVSAIYLLFNLPVAWFCYKALSKRFVKLSLIQILAFSILNEFWHPAPFFDDVTLNILFGGMLSGVASSLALKAGGSAGGTDFIAQYVGNRLHKNIFQFVFYFNCAMFICYGYFYGWIYAGYSIIFQYLATTMISRIYTRYGYTAVEITCKEPTVIRYTFLHTVSHGLSVIPIQGGYSKEQYYLCKAVVSTNEVSRLITALRQADPKCIIYTYRVQNFYGNFHLAPIE